MGKRYLNCHGKTTFKDIEIVQKEKEKNGP
jgi:hypothetical protein